MEFDLKILSNRIREERTKRNLTIEQLSEILDISPSFLGFVERGDRGLSLENVYKLAKSFSISIDSLLDDTNGNNISRDEIIKTLLYNLDDKQFEFVIDMIKMAKQYFKAEKQN